MFRSFASALVLTLVTTLSVSAQIIIDHRCTDIARIPDRYIEKAKNDFRISYGHTSHGSQIISGMQALQKANPALYNFTTSRSSNAPNGALSLWDRIPKGDLGNPNREDWAKRTEDFLKSSGKSRNVVVWSWCGQVSKASRGDIQTYLKLMEDLEKDFPNVKFVYMTGHLDGTGEKGNLNKRNEQIREFCRRNKKILFDFADIESYAPTGSTNYMKMGARDNCQVGRKGNWAEIWLQKNPDNKLILPDRAAHTHPLNGALKGRAFWWMLAEMAGWNPGSKNHNSQIRPVTRTVTAVSQPADNPGKETQRLYDFKKILDYRPWATIGTDKPFIPADGTGIEVPYGKRTGIIYRGQLCVKELEFKMELKRGETVFWYINTDWNGSLNPTTGLGGIINNRYCGLVINGQSDKEKSPIRINSGELHFQIGIKNNKVYWAINGKMLFNKSIPPELAEHKGSLIIGGIKSQAKVNAIFFKGM